MVILSTHVNHYITHDHYSTTHTLLFSKFKSFEKFFLSPHSLQNPKPLSHLVFLTLIHKEYEPSGRRSSRVLQRVYEAITNYEGQSPWFLFHRRASSSSVFSGEERHRNCLG